MPKTKVFLCPENYEVTKNYALEFIDHTLAIQKNRMYRIVHTHPVMF